MPRAYFSPATFRFFKAIGRNNNRTWFNDHKDDYENQVQRLLKAKAKGKQIEAPEPEESAKVLDLTEALRASLESAGRKTKRSATRKSARTAKRAAPSKRSAAKRRTAKRRSA